MWQTGNGVSPLAWVYLHRSAERARPWELARRSAAGRLGLRVHSRPRIELAAAAAGLAVVLLVWAFFLAAVAAPAGRL